MSTTPLAARSPNTHLGNTTNNTTEQDLKCSTMNSMDHHRQMLQDKLESGDKQQASYVSPSDDIMSPCSKKLSNLKGKRFKNAGKPQSLFAKLGKKNYEQSANAATEAEKSA